MQGFHVSPIRQIGISHNSGRVGIHQYYFKAVGLQCFACLRTGIVEFTGLANNNRPRTYDHDALDVVASWHAVLVFMLPHQLDKIVEQIKGVVRPRCCLRMVLHAKGRCVFEPESF